MAEFKKYKKRLCPSGAWDNGCYVLSDEIVHFPDDKLSNDGIIEELQLKKGTAYSTGMKEKTVYFDAFRVTIDNNSWLINEDPRAKVRKMNKILKKN